jgi:hypothetical protein
LCWLIRAANYCRTSDNVRLNLTNVRAKIILIGHWSDPAQKNSHMHFFAVTKSDNIANSLNLHFAIRHSSIFLNIAPEWLYILVSWLIHILWWYYVRLNLVMLAFVRQNSSYVRPKLKVIGQMSCQVKYLFAALLIIPVLFTKRLTRSQGPFMWVLTHYYFTVLNVERNYNLP